MDKLLLMTVIFATVLVPLWVSRRPSPRRAIKRTILFMVLFNLLYMFALLMVWPRLLWSG